MDFDFSSDQKALQSHARRFLEDHCPRETVRGVLDGDTGYDASLWRALAGLGFAATAIPERYGGLGLGYLELCVIAEELGRSLAPTPMSSSIYLAAEFLLASGSVAQKQAWLPKLASGEAVATVALADTAGPLAPHAIRATARQGKIDGVKAPVADGMVADVAIVVVRDEAGGDIALRLLDLAQPGVTREPVSTIDPTRGHARLTFTNAAAEPLGREGDAWPVIQRALDRAAVPFAFEQIGGADRALEMARDYALERRAFGRPIGSFQAIKHMLADMYVAAALARSNAYYAAWALCTDDADLAQAAAAARVSATQAYQHCAKNNIQVHGGMGFTWEFDCHLHYRRANLLALNIGGLPYWQDRLIGQLARRAAA